MDDLPVLDNSELLASLEGDTALYQELVQYYLDTVPGIFDELLAAMHSGTTDQTRRIAHSLKGMTANIGGVRLAAMFNNICHPDKDDPSGNSLMEHPRLVTEYDALLQTLNSIIQKAS